MANHVLDLIFLSQSLDSGRHIDLVKGAGHLLGILVYMCGACVHVCVVSVCVVCEKAKEPQRERK